MPRDRFFVPGVHAAGARVALEPADARKLVTVLRRRSGETVEIVDAAGAVFAGRLVVEGKAVVAVLESAAVRAEPETGARIVLAQAIPKGQKMDFIVEKATELGAWAIVPVRSARVTGERTGDHKVERWRRIARSAAQQSGRTRVPAVEPETDWTALCASFAAYDHVYVPWESAEVRPVRERFEDEARAAASILVVIGPEGGFDAAEVAAAAAAGATPISLGARILRTETAALVVMTALLYARGDL